MSTHPGRAQWGRWTKVCRLGGELDQGKETGTGRERKPKATMGYRGWIGMNGG